MSVRKILVNGRYVWQARVRFHNERKSRLCPDKAAATLAEAELVQEVRAAVNSREEEAAKPATLKALCEAYVLDLEARGKGPDTIGRAVSTAKALALCLPDLLNRPVADLKAGDLFRFRDVRTRGIPDPGNKEEPWLLKPILPSSLNRDFRTLRAMLKKARPDFKFPGGVFFPEDETRVRWLRPEEELLVFAAVPAKVRIGPKRGTRPVPFQAMARLAAITMMRLTEIRTLRRWQVDLMQGVVTLPRTKTKPRHVVLNREAQEILAGALEVAKGDVVFSNPEGQPYSRVYIGRVWRKAARAAGLQDFHFHDLRHHGATQALNGGFTAPIVMALGGWKTERMMMRYAAVTDKTLRAAAEAMSGNFGPKPGNGNGQWSAKDAPALISMAPSQG